MTSRTKHTLSDCFSLRARIGWQGLRSEEFKTEGAYLVTGWDFINGRINWDDCYHVSIDRFEQDKGIQLRENDLLVTKDGTVGKTAFVVDCPEQATLNSHIFLVRSKNDSVEPEYLYYVLNSYLAKEIATDIISNGYFDDYTLLTDEQKKQVEFVQFHPSYDYSDFVEGLRPKVNDDGTMGFELQDGIFKKFVTRARKNFEDSQKSKETIEKEISVQETMTEFFSNIELGVDAFKTINGNEFTVTSVDDKHINISIPGNATVNKLTLNLDEVKKMLESGQKFDRIKDITTFFGKSFATQAYSYDFAIYKAIRAKKSAVSKTKAKQEELKKYIFIIDEINRGEISKIFGELYFAIDPGYRGKAGEISTQYANLHSDPDEKFYIPENVYIIGTMNDIDRSVDSFDFAMRRRFRFVELKADERLEMLASLENEELEAEAIKRMSALNKEIVNVEDLNENYQIGAAYFLKLKTLDFDQLWTDYLQPLLQEYIHGMYDEEGLMSRFAKAYGYQKPVEGDVNETTQDQG